MLEWIEGGIEFLSFYHIFLEVGHFCSLLLLVLNGFDQSKMLQQVLCVRTQIKRGSSIAKLSRVVAVYSPFM